jgi:lysophospholipid acyltransferase (LPLAT)-like uncharacterized protein
MKGGRPRTGVLFRVLVAPFAGLIGFLALLLLRASIRFVYVGCDDLFRKLRDGEGVLAVLWHNQALFMPFLWKGPRGRAHVFVSRSADGELITALLRYFGIRSIRGSSSRGGSVAFLEAVRLSADRSKTFVLTPDGPRGPAFRVKDGLVHLAMRTGMPLYCISVSYTRYKMFESWDGFLLPFPFCRAYFSCSGPMTVEKDVDPAVATRKIQELLDRTNERTMAMALKKGMPPSTGEKNLSENGRNAE